MMDNNFYTSIPNELIQDTTIDIKHKSLLLYLASKARIKELGYNMDCKCTIEELAVVMGISTINKSRANSTIKKLLNKLVDSNWILYEELHHTKELKITVINIVTSKGFTVLPMQVINNYNVKATLAPIFLALKMPEYGKGTSFISLEKVAEILGYLKYDSENKPIINTTLNRGIRELKELKILDIEVRKGQSNLYHFKDMNGKYLYTKIPYSSIYDTSTFKFNKKRDNVISLEKIKGNKKDSTAVQSEESKSNYQPRTRKRIKKRS